MPAPMSGEVDLNLPAKVIPVPVPGVMLHLMRVVPGIALLPGVFHLMEAEVSVVHLRQGEEELPVLLLQGEAVSVQ